MSVVILLISVDVESPFELTEPALLLGVLMTRTGSPLHIEEFDLQEGSRDCSTGTSC